MESFETTDDLDEEMPDLFLSEGCVALLVIINQLEQVATIGVLHHEDQAVCLVLKECLFVPDDVRMVDTCEDSHLVESILFLFR